ncbi:Acg family FMN-binding oxidoreductase [Amycolatopsis suaedae]|uniref:Nitroreductase n=1 Tax=Amycolatopsis suaedae TaxID=2510978 RepID=A0A4Q7JDC7_9PSEU|nr:hypothetical protein [Amycolatopsis suaedae]RZQ65901.1 hypothetical protein EWH70_02170 [Amycolatopsis suaedae]
MSWSSVETAAVARAVSKAPSVHNTQPWALEFHPGRVDLYEVPARGLPQHDPDGRDRLISCGAALTNLRLAVRTLGRATEVELPTGGQQAGLLARVNVGESLLPSDDEVALYAAIFRRRSHRAPFRLRPVSRRSLRALARTAGQVDTEARLIDPRTEAEPLAELLGYAASTFRDQRGYQRELAALAGGFPEPLPRESTLPWGGLVRGDTHLPHPFTLTDRLAREAMLLVVTVDDNWRDHVLAGAALERIWLNAVARGLVASVVTQPLHLHEVRSGLIERLDLAGFPQALLRVGHPVTQQATAGTPLEYQEEIR